MEEFVMFGVPAIVFAACSILGFKLTRGANGMGWFVTSTIWACFTVFLFFALYNSSGWDGLFYVIGLIVVSAPSALGIVAGAITALVKKRNRQVEVTS